MAVWEITVFAAVLSVLYWLWSDWRNTLPGIPCPRGLPLLGNIHQVDLNFPHKTFQQWSRSIGDVFCIKVLGKKSLVLNSYEPIYEALVTRGSDYAGRMQSFREGFVSHEFKDIFLSNPTPRWNLLRKTAHKQIRMYDSGWQRIESVNMEIIGELVRRFKSFGRQPFDPKQSIYNAIMNIMALFLVGKKYEINSEEFQLFEKSEKQLFKYLTVNGWGVELDIMPWLRYLGNSTYKRLHQFCQMRDRLYNILKGEVMESLSKGGSEATEGVMHALMRLFNQQTPGERHSEKGIDELNVKTASFDVIYAGTSTTVTSYYCFLNILVHHPEVERRLREEVDSVVGPDRLVSMKDKDAMPYTRAAILELLRYSSIVNLGVPHKTLQTTVIQGMAVPAGVDVITNLYALHHDKAFWDQPSVYSPDRFLDEDGSLLSASSEVRRHLMAFGAGPRVCLGEVLALNRLFLLVATTCQMFEAKSGPRKVSCERDDYDSGSISCQSPYEICFHCRNEQLFVE